jgi:hypothetical protein
MYEQPPHPGLPSGQAAPGWPVAPPASVVPASPAGTGPRRPVRVLVAAVVSALLLLGLVGNGVAVLAVRGRLDTEKSRLDGELAAHRRAQDKAQQDLKNRFQKADLPAKLQAVRDRNAAASAALLEWGRSGQQLSGLKTVRQARSTCVAAVIEYDTTAAQFPTDMLAGLPQRIDLTDDAVNCGR